MPLFRIIDQEIDLCRAIVARIDFHVMLPIKSQVAERDIEKLSHGVGLTRRGHIAVRLFSRFDLLPNFIISSLEPQVGATLIQLELLWAFKQQAPRSLTHVHRHTMCGAIRS